jgi:hypothetical protein
MQTLVAPVSLALLGTGLVALGGVRDRFSHESIGGETLSQGGQDGDKQAVYAVAVDLGFDLDVLERIEKSNNG